MDSLDAGVAAVFRMVITGDQDQIQQAINNYRDPNGFPHYNYLYQKKDGDGRNLLHYVCMYNTDGVATWMLSLRDHRNIPISKDSDKFGVTAVMYAARTGMVRFVTEWIKRKCNIRTVDKKGMNILDYCYGAVEPIHVLCDTRPKMYNIDRDNMIQMARILMNNGVNCSSLYQTDPINYLYQFNFDKWLSLNASDPDIVLNMWRNIRDRIRILTPNKKHLPREGSWDAFGRLMHVCVAECFILNIKLNNKQRTVMFEERIKTCKPDINEVDDNGMTALHYLCYYEFDSEPYGLREILIGKLLEFGVDPSIKDIRGYTPLMCAVEKGYVVAYDLSDPRDENEQGIGKLLQVNVEASPKLVFDAPHEETGLKKQMKYMSQKIKAQEDVFRNELQRINKEYKEQQLETQAAFNKDIMTLKAGKEELGVQMQGKLEELSKDNNDLKLNVNDLKGKLQDLNNINKELQKRLQECSKDMNVKVKDLHIINNELQQKVENLQVKNNELQQKLQEQCMEKDNLKSEVNDLQCDQNTQNDMQLKLEEQYEEIKNLKIQLEELEKRFEAMPENQEAPTFSLLLGNLVLLDVARHLETDLEVTCLPDASLEDLQATMSKDDQEYKNIYLITENKSTSSDLDNLILQYKKLINASKDKATKLTVASVLPTLDDGDVNDNIEQLNKKLEALCQETGCQFVNNDSTFKFMNGTTNEDCFSEDGKALSQLGIKRLLKALGLLTAKKKQMPATNI